MKRQRQCDGKKASGEKEEEENENKEQVANLFT